MRRFLGRVFGWDEVQMRPEESLLSRLSERDRRDYARWLDAAGQPLTAWFDVAPAVQGLCTITVHPRVLR